MTHRPPAPDATHKVTVRRISDGQLFERWPVDARALVGTGEYELAPVAPLAANQVPAAGHDTH